MVCKQMHVYCYGDVLLKGIFLPTLSVSSYLNQGSAVNLTVFAQIWVRGQHPHAHSGEKWNDTHIGRYEVISRSGVGMLPSSC